MYTVVLFLTTYGEFIEVIILITSEVHDNTKSIHKSLRFLTRVKTY